MFVQLVVAVNDIENGEWMAARLSVRFTKDIALMIWQRKQTTCFESGCNYPFVNYWLPYTLGCWWVSPVLDRLRLWFTTNFDFWTFWISSLGINKGLSCLIFSLISRYSRVTSSVRNSFCFASVDVYVEIKRKTLLPVIIRYSVFLSLSFKTEHQEKKWIKCQKSENVTQFYLEIKINRRLQSVIYCQVHYITQPFFLSCFTFSCFIDTVWFCGI